MVGVRHEVMTAQFLGENALAGGNRFFLAHVIKAVSGPGLFAALDDEGRRVGIELVGVRPDPAELRFLEDESEGVVEFLLGAEPNEFQLAHIDVRLKMLGVSGAGARIEPVGAHHQVVLAAQRHGVLDLVLEAQVDAQFTRALLQQDEELLASDATEAMAAGDGFRALEVDGNVVPVGEAGADRLGAQGIVGGEVGEGFVRQHHAPAEGVVGAVAFEHRDLVRGVAQLHRNGEI